MLQTSYLVANARITWNIQQIFRQNKPDGKTGFLLFRARESKIRH